MSYLEFNNHFYEYKCDAECPMPGYEASMFLLSWEDVPAIWIKGQIWTLIPNKARSIHWEVIDQCAEEAAEEASDDNTEVCLHQ